MSNNILEPIPSNLNDYLLKYNETTLNGSIPSAPNGGTNIIFQMDGFGNISGYVPVMVPFGVGAQLNVTGDSHPQGYNLLNTSVQGFVGLVGAARGWIITNTAAGGYCYLNEYSIYPWTRPIGLGSVSIINMGTNDVSYMSTAQGGGATALTTTHKNFLQATQSAYIVWAGTYDNQKVFGSDFAFTGTWVTLDSVATGFPTWWMFTNTSGSTATATFTGTRGDLILVGSANVGGSYTVTVDGNPVVCLYPSNTTTGSGYTDYTNPAGSNTGVYSVPIRNLSQGTHTVEITALDAGGIGLVGVVGSSVGDSKPLVIQSYVARCAQTSSTYADRSDTLVANVQAGQAITYDQLSEDGFNLVTVNYTSPPATVPPGQTLDQTWWNPNDTSQTYTDGNHPNYIGYQHVATAYLNALNAAGK